MLAAQCRKLDQLLRDLAVERRPACPELATILDEFRRRLLVHLETEEQGGFLDHAALAEPRLAARVERLTEEHDVLRRMVAVLAEGPSSRDGEADWTGFHARFLAFWQVLLDHEQAENDVLHSAYMEDIGGG